MTGRCLKSVPSCDLAVRSGQRQSRKTNTGHEGGCTLLIVGGLHALRVGAFYFSSLRHGKQWPHLSSFMICSSRGDGANWAVESHAYKFQQPLRPLHTKP